MTSQPERLCHGDLIYIANRVFRFEDGIVIILKVSYFGKFLTITFSLDAFLTRKSQNLSLVASTAQPPQSIDAQTNLPLLPSSNTIIR